MLCVFMCLMLTCFPELSLPATHCSWAGSQPAIGQASPDVSLPAAVSWSTPGLC